MFALLRASKKLSVNPATNIIVQSSFERPTPAISTLSIYNFPLNYCDSQTIVQNGLQVCFNFLSIRKLFFFCFAFQTRTFASAPQNKGGFFGQVFENIKQEIEKNKEMKENLKKFRQEAQKLEESDALKKARQKFVC